MILSFLITITIRNTTPLLENLLHPLWLREKNCEFLLKNDTFSENFGTSYQIWKSSLLDSAFSWKLPPALIWPQPCPTMSLIHFKCWWQTEFWIVDGIQLEFWKMTKNQHELSQILEISEWNPSKIRVSRSENFSAEISKLASLIYEGKQANSRCCLHYDKKNQTMIIVTVVFSY